MSSIEAELEKEVSEEMAADSPDDKSEISDKETRDSTSTLDTIISGSSENGTNINADTSIKPDTEPIDVAASSDSSAKSYTSSDVSIITQASSETSTRICGISSTTDLFGRNTGNASVPVEYPSNSYTSTDYSVITTASSWSSAKVIASSSGVSVVASASSESSAKSFSSGDETPLIASVSCESSAEVCTASKVADESGPVSEQDRTNVGDSTRNQQSTADKEKTKAIFKTKMDDSSLSSGENPAGVAPEANPTNSGKTPSGWPWEGYPRIVIEYNLDTSHEEEEGVPQEVVPPEVVPQEVDFDPRLHQALSNSPDESDDNCLFICLDAVWRAWGKLSLFVSSFTISILFLCFLLGVTIATGYYTLRFSQKCLRGTELTHFTMLICGFAVFWAFMRIGLLIKLCCRGFRNYDEGRAAAMYLDVAMSAFFFSGALYFATQNPSFDIMSKNYCHIVYYHFLSWVYYGVTGLIFVTVVLNLPAIVSLFRPVVRLPPELVRT